MCFIAFLEAFARTSRTLICHSVRKVSDLIEVKTSLDALSKHFVGIELDSRVTLGSVTLVRLKSARVTAIWIGDRYMR